MNSPVGEESPGRMSRESVTVEEERREPVPSILLTQIQTDIQAQTHKQAHSQSNSTIVELNPIHHGRGGTKDFGFLPIPKRLQYDPTRGFTFTTSLNITFGFASTFTVANLYYCQPLLIQFAESFNTSHEEVSKIPTLVQAGYATGLLLLSPLGDLVRRRPLLLLLVFVSGTLTIGLSITTSLAAFQALSFLVGIFTVTPQILIPYAADLAPPNRRASSISIVLSGLLLGVLIARVLAGIVAQFGRNWRIVYFLAVGVQAFILLILYFVLPDYPAKNVGEEEEEANLKTQVKESIGEGALRQQPKKSTGKKKLTYPHILYTMGKYALTEPVLIQAGLMQCAASACFSNFWVTLTFLLGGEPYNYDTLQIGLFGLIGIMGVATGPFLGRLIDHLIPWYTALLATLLQLVFQAVQTGAGGIHISAVILACFGLDVGRQIQQVSMTTVVYNISSSSRARMNAVLIIWIFIGQVMGTSAGTKLFLLKPPDSPDGLPGWRASSLFALCLYVFQLIVLSIRGPGCKRYEWFGGYGSKIGWWKETKKVEAGKMIDLEARGQEKKGEEIEVGLEKEEKEEKEEKKKEVIV
ncbi:MFS general substrate transporter [Pyrrhoderma noxium]|uniref:MFS general substrate transporter n=1 Tax=Pyrrhoderma noxium TaxID=2282107 RepID=A0A286UB96_9AGAM|nr:MFS general substrate transporter [Pyrrhoderma noxium]